MKFSVLSILHKPSLGTNTIAGLKIDLIRPRGSQLIHNIDLYMGIYVFNYLLEQIIGDIKKFIKIYIIKFNTLHPLLPLWILGCMTILE